MKALLVGMLLVATVFTAIPVASAAPHYECMDYYRETHVGPYIIVQRSSCQVEICYETTTNCGLLQ